MPLSVKVTGMLTKDMQTNYKFKTEVIFSSTQTKEGITYFEFSGMIVDNDGLNICSRRVSMNDGLTAQRPN